ncbi:MAG: tetratricopeptide repeat protein [Candidatus Altiarchaeota archaeon]|nr:tetratricopeptide repeat protein [Candidatus Altiarchaeota archaeon]
MAEKGKDTKKKYDLRPDEGKLGREEADRQMEQFLKDLEEHFKDVPEEEIKAGAERMMEFIKGKLSWADLFNFTPEMLFQMAEYGLTQFKVGRYEEAERVFKVLTVLDWDNAYYHSVMGSILQREKRYGEAIAEYEQALELDSNDSTSLTNRGEIYMQHGLLAEAKADFEKAVALDPKGEDKWANRARMLLVEIERQRTEKSGKDKKKGTQQ